MLGGRRRREEQTAQEGGGGSTGVQQEQCPPRQPGSVGRPALVSEPGMQYECGSLKVWFPIVGLEACRRTTAGGEGSCALHVVYGNSQHIVLGTFHLGRKFVERMQY